MWPHHSLRTGQQGLRKHDRWGAEQSQPGGDHCQRFIDSEIPPLPPSGSGETSGRVVRDRSLQGRLTHV